MSKNVVVPKNAHFSFRMTNGSGEDIIDKATNILYESGASEEYVELFLSRCTNYDAIVTAIYTFLKVRD